jgi:hypothetical protein
MHDTQRIGRRATLLVCLSALTALPALAQQNDNEVTQLLERLDILPPHHYGGLTLFPLQLRGTEDEGDYASLDEAFRSGILRVWDTAAVARVCMQNTSRHEWVFAMGGEVILGGKQNRMLRGDVLLPPDSRPIEVPTYCVEKDRWTGHAEEKFSAGRGVGQFALRQKALAAAPQAEVWAEVDEAQRRFRVATPTRDMDAVMSDPAVARELAGYRDAFDRVWQPRVVGFVVAQGGRIVAADAFCNPRLFWKLRQKLLDSYAFDCIGRFRDLRPPELPQTAARDFMAQVYLARFSVGGTPGAGSELEFSGSGVAGSALVHRRAVIHLVVSPGQRIIPPPHPPQPPIPIPRPE